MSCYDVISHEVALEPRSNNTQYSASRTVKKHVLYMGLSRPFEICLILAIFLVIFKG
jgi:hypothetical protein